MDTEEPNHLRHKAITLRSYSLIKYLKHQILFIKEFAFTQNSSLWIISWKTLFSLTIFLLLTGYFHAHSYSFSRTLDPCQTCDFYLCPHGHLCEKNQLLPHQHPIWNSHHTLMYFLALHLVSDSSWVWQKVNNFECTNFQSLTQVLTDLSQSRPLYASHHSRVLLEATSSLILTTSQLNSTNI